MSRLKYLGVVLLLVAIALFGLAYPIYVIRPFRHQGPDELQLALVVLRYRNIAEILIVLATLGVVAVRWRGSRVLTKALSVAAVAVVCLCAVLSRVNVYEIMFHPVGQPSFGKVVETHLNGDERVIAVKVGSAARAYPIRAISYHHIVNDVVSDVPIVATY